MNRSAGKSILVIDDDAEVRSVLRRAFEQNGWSVGEAGSKSQAEQLLSVCEFDLITLDLRLGEVDGLELARKFRAKRNIPVVMITGKDTMLDRIAGLEHGADDYIVKPFNIREVILRIENIMRRYERPASAAPAPRPDGSRAERFTFDNCQLDALTRELMTQQGEKIELTDFEFRLLTLFVANPGRVLSRGQISMSLNGHDWSPLDRTIDGHIARLRRKIEYNEDEPRLIKSVRNVGYVFAGEVFSS